MKPYGPPRAVRSPRYDTAVRGARLTDKRILSYILAGHYGEQRRLDALAAQKPKPRKREKRTPKQNLALDLLK